MTGRRPDEIVNLSSVRRRARRARAAASPEIIEAAARVFAERGFHGASTQDIADVLGIRQASLYYYFPSKEVALELVCLQGVEGFFEAAKAIADGLRQRRRQARAPGQIASCRRLLDRSDFVRVFLNERQHLPAESRRRIGKWSRGLERIFEDVLKEGVRTRRVPRRSRHAPGGARDSRHDECGRRTGIRKEEVPHRTHRRRVLPACCSTAL